MAFSSNFVVESGVYDLSVVGDKDFVVKTLEGFLVRLGSKGVLHTDEQKLKEICDSVDFLGGDLANLTLPGVDVVLTDTDSSGSSGNSKPTTSFRSKLNEWSQHNKSPLNINVVPCEDGYKVAIREKTFGPYLVERKKIAIELASEAYLSFLSNSLRSL